MSKMFDINRSIRVVAVSEKTRNGFRHVATLFVNGREVDSAKVSYQNRTWESYEFETVLRRLLEKTTALNDKGKAAFKAFIDKDQTDWSGFQQTARVAALGEVLGRSQKEKNDWKARMLKAGLGSSGLEMPEDWETLTEDEKERRLNNVLAELRRH